MKKAVRIKSLSNFQGYAELYKLSEPLEGHEFVVVSAAFTIDQGPETYIFPANEDGEVLKWGELEGSFIGKMDTEQAIKNAGYTIVIKGD